MIVEVFHAGFTGSAGCCISPWREGSPTMNNVISALSRSLAFALAIGSFAGCHSSTQVAANAGTAAGKVNGNLSSSGLVAPDNFIALEDRRETAPLVPSAGMGWRWDAVRTTARFGPFPTATAFSIECSADRNQLIFHRFLGARGSSTGTMSFTGNGHVASLPAATTGDAGSQAGIWQAAASTSDLMAAVAKVFTGTAPAQIAVSGSTELITAPSPITQLPFTSCNH